jgi:hypothetical protein
MSTQLSAIQAKVASQERITRSEIEWLWHNAKDEELSRLASDGAGEISQTG